MHSNVLCMCVTQVTTTSLDLPFAAFAPRAYDLEENDPMVLKEKNTHTYYAFQIKSPNKLFV